MESKSVWRRRCRQRRRLAFQDEVKVWAKALTTAALFAPDGALAAVLPQERGLVAAYLSYGTEPSTNQLISHLLATGHQVIVPAPGPDQQRLAWVEVEARNSLELCTSSSRVSRTLPSTAITQVKCIFVPALAVDASGTRLGQGGGWYDRVLPTANPEALRLAMVNSAELLPAGTLPRLPHDQAMTHALLPGGPIQLAPSSTIPEVRPSTVPVHSRAPNSGRDHW